jgi:hypothetical protein
MGQEEPRAPRRVRGRWGWRGRGHSDHQLPQRERAGEQRAAGVGRQVVAVVRGVEEHDQRTAVVLADLFTDRTPVLSGNVDNDHIGRRSTPGQLQRSLDHVDGAILTEQAEQLDTRPHTSIQQGHALRDLWCWHLSSLGGLATSGHQPKWSALLGRRAEHVAVVTTGTPWCRGWEARTGILASGQVPHKTLPTDQALHGHISSPRPRKSRRAAPYRRPLPQGQGRARPAAGPASRSLIDPNIIHQQRLGKRRAGIRTSRPLPSDRDVENQKERMVEHPP